MNERFRSLAYKAGFVFWNTEENASRPIDWASNYDEEFDKFCELVVRECSTIIQDFVDLRAPASDYPSKLRHHFGFE